MISRETPHPGALTELINDEMRGNLDRELGVAIKTITSYHAETLLDRTVAGAADDVYVDRRVPPLVVHWHKAGTEGVQEAIILNSAVSSPSDTSSQEHGQQIIIEIPFTGDKWIFDLRPFIKVREQQGVAAWASVLRIYMADIHLTLEAISDRVGEVENALNPLIEQANIAIDAHNERLRELLVTQFEERRRRLIEQRALTASLPFDLRPSGVQLTEAVTLSPRRPNLDTHRSASVFAPEPALDEAQYEAILETIVSTTRLMETVPRTVEPANEEDLRNLLLFCLNLFFRGETGAEEFRREGKTDITVKHRNKMVFIAECKIYDGPKKLADAVDQLLRYTTWRDSKAAVILFIRQGRATDIIAKSDAAISQHEQFAHRYTPMDPATRIDYDLRSTLDDHRIIRTALLPVVFGPGRANLVRDDGPSTTDTSERSEPVTAGADEELIARPDWVD